MLNYVIVFILATLSQSIEGSVGDRSQYYIHCIENCYVNKCNHDGSFVENPSFALRLFCWDCKGNCSYTCMWKTVEFFEIHGLNVPQFHGKWPFVRLFGVQEPASVLFSMLNLYAIVKMYIKFRKLAFTKSPMFYVWTYFTLVSINGWFWSSVFHTRDTEFTEFMDYSSAFTTVLTLLYCLLLRISYKESSNFKVFAMITCLYISVLYTHITYLWSGRINYDYNMKFNIVLGFISFVLMMIWWYKNSKKLPHSYFIGWFTVLSVMVTSLEILDFSPIFWTFDAHSLWHGSTIPLVSLLYRFMIEDCEYLDNYYLKLKDYMK